MRVLSIFCPGRAKDIVRTCSTKHTCPRIAMKAATCVLEGKGELTRAITEFNNDATVSSKHWHLTCPGNIIYTIYTISHSFP